jgi:hypothetical protein
MTPTEPAIDHEEGDSQGDQQPGRIGSTDTTVMTSTTSQTRGSVGTKMSTIPAEAA